MTHDDNALIVGHRVWIIDYEGFVEKPNAYVFQAKITKVEKNYIVVSFIEKHAGIVVHRYNTYNTESMNKLFFDSKAAAYSALYTLPEPGDFVYTISSKNRVMKKRVDCIIGHPAPKYYKLYIMLRGGKCYSINSIDNEVFLSYKEARAEADRRKKDTKGEA